MLVLRAKPGSSARASRAGPVSLFLFNSVSHLPPLRDPFQSSGPLLLWQFNFSPLFVCDLSTAVDNIGQACMGGLQVDWDSWRPETTSGSIRTSYTSFETRSRIGGELTNDSSLAGPSLPKFGMGQQTQHFYVGSGESNLDPQAKGLYP